ncbi:MAG: GDSL-type esterase/lipase family protein, partial [Bacteroidota bacterium]
TTDELKKGILDADIKKEYSIVSLLIGVNNQYRGYPISQYKKEFEELLIQAIAYAGGKPENVFVVSIPDYGVTPFSKEKGLDVKKIASELYRYNEVAETITKTKNAHFTNITKDSKLASEDQTLVASDGLHPSIKMYTQWVNAVYPSIYDNLLSR